jgi:hypothetical protein
MATPLLAPPAADEFGPFYAGYIARVPVGDVRDTLATQLAGTRHLVEEFGEARADHRYAPDKWTVREVVSHLADTERVFAYRALRIARGDATPLPGFDENAYVAHANAARRPLADVVAELEAVRHATLALLAGLDDTALLRRGTASNHPLTPRAAAYIIAGHELHHAAILRERY